MINNEEGIMIMMEKLETVMIITSLYLYYSIRLKVIIEIFLVLRFVIILLLLLLIMERCFDFYQDVLNLILSIDFTIKLNFNFI